MKHLVMAALLGAAALLGPPPVAAADAAPAATIAQGRLAGARDAGVERFLDIPFAAAPVGALRW
ncbi:MAG: carboxylesterase family protein, partial [Alphaproteobacteria bacterium]|nr:carboxylesterase family protein [Alphaproteobacteria bacterium]